MKKDFIIIDNGFSQKTSSYDTLTPTEALQVLGGAVIGNGQVGPCWTLCPSDIPPPPPPICCAYMP